MNNANALEAARQAEVNKQQKSDVWRGVRNLKHFDSSPRSALAQDNNRKDYPEWDGEYNAASTKVAADIEAIRSAAVNHQEKSDVWRGVREIPVFGASPRSQ